MNKKILALSLLTTPFLMAQEGDHTNQPHQPTCYWDTYSSSCSCDPCSCNTCSCSCNNTCSCSCSCNNTCSCSCCYVPKPKKSIDCECFTPQFYDLQCAYGFFFSGEFLYWYAKETKLPIAARLIFKASSNNIEDIRDFGFIKNFEYFDTKWAPGLRIGVGHNSECDGWDYFLNWTYFHNSVKESLKISSNTSQEEIFLNPWINSPINGNENNSSINLGLFNILSAKWETRFNQIDAEIGRKYWLSHCFNIRPFAGVRGAWTRTVFSEKGKLEPPARIAEILVDQSTDRFKNRLWGAGFFTGIQPNWYFCCNFILYANLDAALLWGEFESKKKENLNFVTEPSPDEVLTINQKNNFKDSFFNMSALIDLGIGLRWEENWCCDRYRTSLDLGWEHHIWFDHGYHYKSFGSATKIVDKETTDVVPLNFDYDVSNLSYGGLVVRLRFDF